jgi:transcriptional regulator with XRE-family HTH domain
VRIDTGRLRVVGLEAATAHVGGVGEDGPPTPGQYLREQRQRRNMSLDQLAAATKIPRNKLELLEADRHDELPGPVFVKGFLRCCARALALDPQVLLDLTYEQERRRLRGRRRDAGGTGSGGPRPISGSIAPAAARGTGWRAWLWSRVADPRVLLWILVALLVALVVIVAFTLAGGQAAGPAQS